MSAEMKPVISLGLYSPLYLRYRRATERVYRSSTRYSSSLAVKIGFFSSSGFASWSLIFWLAGYLAQERQCSTTDIVRAISATSYCANFAAAYLSQIPDADSGLAAAKRVFSLLQLQLGPSAPSAVEHHQRAITRGKIVFENVSFSYPSRPDALVLDNVSFEIAAGSSAAFVGSSGSGLLQFNIELSVLINSSGKSTVIALLERMYEPNSGRILVDDVDISQIEITEYRRSIGLVAQNPKLFDTSVEDNIAYGLAKRPSDVCSC
jgi:ABC-type multidrug transport system fused ATPase/permease subunit